MKTPDPSNGKTRFRLRPSPSASFSILIPNTGKRSECNWDSGGACTAVLSTHTPESCLPLTGLVQINPPRGSPPRCDTRPDRRPRSYVRSLRIRPRLANYLYFVVFGPTNCFLEPRMNSLPVVIVLKVVSMLALREEGT